jgi:hypothetical protein
MSGGKLSRQFHAEPEALVTGGVLDDSVERDELAHDDLSHFGPPSSPLASLLRLLRRPPRPNFRF